MVRLTNPKSPGADFRLHMHYRFEVCFSPPEIQQYQVFFSFLLLINTTNANNFVLLLSLLMGVAVCSCAQVNVIVEHF